MLSLSSIYYADALSYYGSEDVTRPLDGLFLERLPPKDVSFFTRDFITT
jgi:hypothetical protein